MIPFHNGSATLNIDQQLGAGGRGRAESYQESSIIRKPRHTCCEFHSQLTPSSFLYIIRKYPRFSFSLTYRETLLSRHWSKK